jgi:uncharacterized protein (DUF1330 family)
MDGISRSLLQGLTEALSGNTVIPSAEIRRRRSEAASLRISPPSKARSMPFAAAMIGALLISVAGVSPVAAGKGSHGMGGIGMQGGLKPGWNPGGRGSLLPPAYLLITALKITNGDAFKAALGDLIVSTTPFAGRLAVNMDKPVSWKGAAPERVVMIQFDSPDQAQGWKNSDAFKDFDAELRQSSDSVMQLLQALPGAADRSEGQGGRSNVGFDQKGFEPLVKKYDETLKNMPDVCKGC